jgi:small subunit ribosomal protein S11
LVMAEDNTTTSSIAESTPATIIAPVKAAKKKQRRSVPAGQLHIQATFNNTIVAFTDKTGKVLASSSAGAAGFRGSKKGTAYAAQIAAEKVAELARSQFGARSVDIFVKGVGLGRDAAIRAMGSFEISVDSIKDITGIQHGGVRPRKARRS